MARYPRPERIREAPGATDQDALAEPTRTFAISPTPALYQIEGKGQNQLNPAGLCLLFRIIQYPTILFDGVSRLSRTSVRYVAEHLKHEKNYMWKNRRILYPRYAAAIVYGFARSFPTKSVHSLS
jgi:hypothetical protein